jgi:hypothetical protein
MDWIDVISGTVGAVVAWVLAIKCLANLPSANPKAGLAEAKADLCRMQEERGCASASPDYQDAKKRVLINQAAIDREQAREQVSRERERASRPIPARAPDKVDDLPIPGQN